MIDFIIPTYNRINELRMMLSSLIAQTSDDWKATVVIDGSKKLFDVVHHDNIRYITLDKRYNNWGHTPREIGKQQTDCEYVIMTGDDNYYCPTTVSDILNMIDKHHPDIIYWDMVHSHYNYQYFKCQLRTQAIDMGAFCTKSSLAKQIKLGTNFAADGDYVEAFKKKFPKAIVKKIDKVLFVHN